MMIIDVLILPTVGRFQFGYIFVKSDKTIVTQMYIETKGFEEEREITINYAHILVQEYQCTLLLLRYNGTIFSSPKKYYPHRKAHLELFYGALNLTLCSVFTKNAFLPQRVFHYCYVDAHKISFLIFFNLIFQWTEKNPPKVQKEASCLYYTAKITDFIIERMNPFFRKIFECILQWLK